MKVGGNTHLKGAVIESRAEASKNHFKTQSLTHTDIENHSEVEVKSISAGLSTDMAQNAKNAMATAASLLGNKQESERSTTKSAISENIHIDTETPENLTALSRDTQNANQKVKAFDLTEIKEQQEAAQVAGALFSKITGDVAKAFDFEDGSQEKILMHGLAGALAAKIGDGNIATGAVAGAGSEWLNTYVADYLKAQTQGLNLEPQQKEKLRQAAQQATALIIGAMAGAVTGGSSETVKQGALASYNAESFNRQLHPEQIELIRERAKNFAEQQGISEEQALAQLTAEALRGESDDFTYVEKNQAARDYLNNLAKETKVPTLFSELDRKSDEYRNSLLNAQYVTANQDLYNRVNQNFSHRDEYWFRNRLEQGYSDGQKTPTDGLVGETVLGHLETLAQNPSFDSSVKSNKDLQKEVYSAINESMLMVRGENPNAFQIGDMSYPNLKRLGMMGYFPEPGLEGVYPELLLIPTPVKGIGSGVTQGAARVLSTADKYTQGAVKFTAKHPVTAEMLATGVYKTGEISYNAYNGQYKKDGELENAIYDAIKI